MKKVNGILEGVTLEIIVPQTLNEFKEGARLLGGTLQYNQALLFDFKSPMQIVLENSGVEHDLQVLYFPRFSKCGIAEESKILKAFDVSHVNSTGFYPIALELRQDFCKTNNIGKGSTLFIKW